VHLQHFNALVSEVRIDLYIGDGVAAWERIERSMAAFERALLLRAQTILTSALVAHAHAALGAAAAGRRELVAVAERDAKRLLREKAPYCVALAQQVLAAVELHRGRLEPALAKMAEAERLLEATEMHQHVQVARWHRGHLLRGDEGARLVAESEAYFRREGVRRPERMTATLMPPPGSW
jgi:ATP/maltotriose-dependent transcriptional regulator MalT